VTSCKGCGINRGPLSHDRFQAASCSLAKASSLRGACPRSAVSSESSASEEKSSLEIGAKHHAHVERRPRRHLVAYLGFERLHVSASTLAKTRMANSVDDASWSSLRNKFAYKAIAHGALFEKVDQKRFDPNLFVVRF
jgi:hypothetical protein